MATGQMIDTKRYAYPRVKIRGKDGKARYSAGNQDAVARAMLGMDKAALVATMKANKLEDKCAKHSKGKNSGHFRMILGQALRGKVNRDEAVKVRGITITKLSQKVALPAGFTQEPIKARPNGAKKGKKK